MLNHSGHEFKDAKNFPRTEQVKGLIDACEKVEEGLKNHIAQIRNHKDALTKIYNKNRVFNTKEVSECISNSTDMLDRTQKFLNLGLYLPSHEAILN